MTIEGFLKGEQHGDGHFACLTPFILATSIETENQELRVRCMMPDTNQQK
jgi:hypothetical protein